MGIGNEMRHAFALFLLALFMAVGVATAEAQQTRPTKTVGVVLVVPPTGHLARNGWFTRTSCDFFDLGELNLYGAVFDAVNSAISSRYRVARVSVAPGSVIRTRNTEVFGAFKLFPPVGEQVRQFSRPERPVDIYLVIWSSLSANTCDLHPNTPVGFGIGLTKIGSGPTHLHAFGEAFVVDARTLQTSASVNLSSAFVRLDRFEWRDTRAQLSDQQWQTIRTLIPRVLAAAVQSASRQLLDVH